jgi:stage II sporulation protein AA (anti-sigma F factor antagonist)
VGSVTVRTGGDGVLDVVLHGEIDYTNADPVARSAREAVVRARPATVRVDMAEVSFLDSSGIRALILVMKAAQEVGAEFRVGAVTHRVFDQLRMTGLVDLFPVAEPPTAAGG